MPLAIMKLAIAATTATTVAPVSTRFFAIAPTDVPGGGTLTLDTSQFFDDAGNTPAALPALNPGNSTIQLNINGVLQMEGIYTYTPGATGAGGVVITVPDAGSILAGSPIIVEVVNFAPSGTTDIAT